MARADFSLDHLRRNARESFKTGKYGAGVVFGVGLMMPALTIFLAESAPHWKVYVIIAISILLGILISILVCSRLIRSWRSRLCGHIQGNIVDHQMLLIALSDDYGEQMPSLLEADPIEASFVKSKTPTTAHRRLASLSDSYEKCARDLQLVPLPRLFKQARLAFIIGSLMFIVLAVLFSEALGEGWFQQTVSATVFILSAGSFGLYLILHTLIQSTVSEVIADQLDSGLAGSDLE